jgi:DnaK suppressor protein
MGGHPMSSAKVWNADFSHLLRARRRDAQDDVQSRLRDGRAIREIEVRDQLDHSDDNNQADIDLALLQMRTSVLGQIDHALARLDAGAYGICVDCSRAIAQPRLLAMPFAVRCQPCQEKREGRSR